jgi:hypothetical protein
MTPFRKYLLPLLAAAALPVCRAAAENTDPWAAFEALQKEARQLAREKQLDQARTVYIRMQERGQAILAGDLPLERKLAAGLAMADILAEEGERDQLRSLCERLAQLPGITAGDRARILCVLGDYEQALAIPELTSADQAFVLGKLGTHYWRSDRNPERLRPVVERMLALNDPSLRLPHWLRVLATHQHPNTSYRRPETVEFAWSQFLRQPGLSAGNKALAYAELIEAKIVLGKTAEALQLAAAAGGDETLPLVTRLMAQLVSMGLNAGDSPVAEQAIDQAGAALAAGPQERYQALHATAAALKRHAEGHIARGFARQAAALAANPVPRHTCRFMAQPPLGAAGWLASDLLNHPDYRVGNFREYSQKDAAALATDVNAERVVGAADDKRAAYFEHTAFYMVYDTAGWHIFVLCGEPGLAGRMTRGDTLGSLEMYFAPTPDHPYYQWIIDLKDGKVSAYDWSSPHRDFRAAGPYLRTDTRILGNQIGVHIFFPWEMLYNALPFDTAGPWLFEVIRWSPAGGLSWSGGRVHNTGKWGEIDWQAPPPGQLAQIRLDLLRKGWRSYRQTRRQRVADYWASRDFGDPGFMREALTPAVKRLDDFGAQLESVDPPANEIVERLFREALGDWMAFDYTIAALRRRYLEQRFTAPAEGAER